MKRVLKFHTTDNGYGFFEEDSLIFEISRVSLQFNVKDFYYAFFADDLDYSDMQLENLVSNDKKAKRIFQCVKQLVDEVVQKLNNELVSEEEDIVVE